MLKKLAIALTCADRDYVYAGFNRLRRRKEDRRGKRCETGCHGRSCELFQTGSQ